MALPVVSDWYRDERQLQSDGRSNGKASRPSESQSAVVCFYASPDIAESAYLSRFLCSRLLAVSAYCALSGVKSGDNTGLVHRRQDLQCLIFHPASRCTPETLPPVVRRFPAP